jgi:hypothetical protein
VTPGVARADRDRALHPHLSQALPLSSSSQQQPSLHIAPTGLLSLTRNGARGARRHALTLLVLAASHEAVTTGRTVTLRDLYYALKGIGAAKTPASVSAAVGDAGALLGAPRADLAIRAAPRGAVAGALALDDGGGWADCASVGAAGRALPGCAAAAHALRVRTAARFLLVVEKEAVFERLVEDRVWEQVRGGCVVVTGRGVPDVATRAFCASVAAKHALTPVGLGKPCWVGWVKEWREWVWRAHADPTFLLPSQSTGTPLVQAFLHFTSLVRAAPRAGARAQTR